MTVLIVGDLHLDMWTEAGRDPFAALSAAKWSGIEAVIVAGDLTNKPRVRWKYAIRHLARYIDPGRVHILPGNHDYYDFKLDGEDRLAEIATREGANFVQKAEILIGKTRFLCCTLWTDFALYGDVAASQAIAKSRMNDYRYIRNAGAGYRRIRPYETALIHADHRSWLENRLSNPHAGPTIVVTHHCPHPGLISETPGELDPIYGSDLTDLIQRHQPEEWMFGHTHLQAETVVGRTLMRNVSLGYPDQVLTGQEGQILRRGLIDLQNLE
ncbi:Calcineurin-like phosphoesterase superfamily domain [Roseovarius sp. EC-HK134]|uniref:metallophosphoesterase n=1 Tax=unclassified Roseovarius TaxID=2614913 RepID=UPI001253BDA9|nr:MULTISPECIES: metallophosphoesterase [unclassified Roseovarius]VVT22662.1 Calcineurin-like phosphoesterase superfamily domain [Roseovarius sp. EC-SD190]VVT22907.1 Calcineurin-like phosphoesterase superfamily domain [Roseovarius sp. EC-HK134]